MKATGTLGWQHWRDPAVLAVCGFGTGFSPVAPGTVGSLGAVVVWWFLLKDLAWFWQLGAIAAVTILGVWLIARVNARYGVGDAGAIVIDEVAGQWIALLLAPASLLAVVLAFALFRLFDVWKPWPVGWLDRNLRGAWGVMADDLAAGGMAFAVLQFTFLILPHI
ncbi:MAG: phosphatidylglycerophosphatase A [Pseudomonadota bacterium]